MRHPPLLAGPALALALALGACGGGPPLEAGPAGVPGSQQVARPGRYAPTLEPRLTADGARWVDSTLASLSVRAAAAQLVIQWMPGAYVSPTDPAFDEPRRWVEEEGIGGIYLSIGSPLAFAAGTGRRRRRPASWCTIES